MQGTPEQKKRFLTPLASGKKIGAWALTEPGSGSDAAGLKTTAVPKDGGWLLNGTKTFCTHATVGDTAVIITLTDKSDPHHGCTAFVVEKGTPGFKHGKKEDKLGLRASDTGELIFEDCFLPDENRLGAVGHGFTDALKVLDGGRISIAALSLGAQGPRDDWATPSSEWRSARSSPSFRPSNSSWPTWPRASKPPAFSPSRRRSARTGDCP
jgi:alkylation response protein AidB-like acyl-CoA dehydrogenase